MWGKNGDKKCDEKCWWKNWNKNLWKICLPKEIVLTEMWGGISDKRICEEKNMVTIVGTKIVSTKEFTKTVVANKYKNKVCEINYCDEKIWKIVKKQNFVTKILMK